MTLSATARTTALLLAATGMVLPAASNANSAATTYFANRANRGAVPTLLTQDERSYYRELFAAIERSNWAQVQTLFAQKADGPLHRVAKAEYYLAAGSPKIDLDTLALWLAGGTELPQAEQIEGLATRRGASVLPPLPQARALIALPSRARRVRPRDTNDGTMPGAVANAV